MNSIDGSSAPETASTTSSKSILGDDTTLGQCGFPMSRLICNMEWAAEDRPAVDDVLEYEMRFNDVVAEYRDPVICTYDLSKFRADFVIDVM